MPDSRGADAIVQSLAQLERGASTMTTRQRRIVGLQAAGYHHQEIAELTGDSRRTVERQLARGRARARAVV